jgi:hypothetical protein
VKPIKAKVLISLLLTLSFLSASLSGILLYFSPRGRIANWTDWSILGLTKEGWTDIHITAVALMLVTGLLHLFWINWKVFLTYLSKATSGPLRYPRELILSVLLFVLISVGTLVPIPGVDALLVVRDSILDSFEVEKNLPPVAHAEELTLRQAAADLYEKQIDDILQRLDDLGWPAEADQTLDEIAERHGTTPQIIHEELLRQPAVQGSGAGYGRMTLKALAESAGLELGPLLDRAAELGASGLTGDEVVKNVAESLGMAPYDLLPKLDERLSHE